MRGDFGLTNEMCCSGSTDNSIYTMTVATANVRTLHPKEETESRSRFGGTLMVGKVERLESALRDAGIDVIGLQESRSREAGIFNGPFVSQILTVAQLTATAMLNASCGSQRRGSSRCSRWTTSPRDSWLSLGGERTVELS